jgi:hypothetical protein
MQGRVLIMYQIGLKREEYLEGTIPDIRSIFIGFGKFLFQKGINDEGSISDYEDYLLELDKQNELKREDEHLELICWISEQQEWENNFMIIKKEDWDKFWNSNNEDEVMDMIIAEHDEVYTKFKEMTGVDLLEIDNIVSMTYIDDARNDIEIIVK